MFFKVFVLLPALLLVQALKSIIFRKQKEMTEDRGVEIGTISSLIIIVISYFLMKKKNPKKTFLPTFNTAFLFFISTLLYFYSNANLSPMVETICNKSSIIIAFILNFLFINRKTHFTQLIGLCCVLLSFIMIAATAPKKSTQLNQINYVMIFASQAALEGVAFFNFDYFIVKNVDDFFHYAFISQIFYVLLNICYVTYITAFNNYKPLSQYTNPYFYLLILLFFGISALWFCMSFCYELVPRMLLFAVVYTFSDVLSEGYLYQWQYKNVPWYCLCVIGVLIYEGKQIKKYFQERKVIK